MKRLFILFSIALVLLPAHSLMAKDIKGRVVDETGLTLPGVSVFVKGTSNGSITDIDGNFTLNASENDTIVFSYIGYNTISKHIGNQLNFDIKLLPETELLDEVVVVGYGTQQSKDLTAPITTVKSEELAKVNSSNPVQALQGKVAGVQITQGGAPGSAPSIKIRGVGAMTDNEAHTKPLYVVDGVFVDDISFVDNNDIESLTILKDASASAIYGVRAANGVVLITTKKGNLTNISVGYSGFAGVSFAVNKLDMLGKDEYVEMINEMRKLDPQNYPVIDANSFKNSTDWYNEILRTAKVKSHAVTVSGGSESGNFNLGVNYFNQEGILDADNSYERFNINYRSNYKLTERLKVGASTIISRWNKTNANQNVFYQAYINPPVYAPINHANKNAFPKKYDSPSSYPFAGSFANPSALLDYYDSYSEGYKVIANLNAELDIVPKFIKFKTSYGVNLDIGNNRDYVPRYFVDGIQSNSQSKLTKQSYQNSNYVWDNTLSITKNSKDLGNFNLLVGQSLREQKNGSLTGVAVKVPGADDQEKYLTNGSELNRDANDYGYKYRALSFFTRLAYSKENKYLMSATFRADGSSKYTDKWGYFPSLGLGWVMSQENFMKGSGFDNLKLRAGWGLIGNDNVESYSSQILGYTGVGASGVFGPDKLIEGAGAQTLVKKELKWQSVGEFNLGFDYALLNNKLTGSLDMFDRRTYDAIFYAPVSSGGGTANLYGNNGSFLNQGVEFVVSYGDAITKDLSYNLSFNATLLRNEVLEMTGSSSIRGGEVRGNYVTNTKEGSPIGAFWGYEVDGIYQTVAETFENPEANVGYFKYKDQNGDGKIDQKDMVELGNPSPDAILGFDFSLAYKNFSFSMSLYSQLGNDIYNAKRAYRDVASEANFDKDFYKNRWSAKGTSNSYPSSYALLKGYNLKPNSFFVEDASFLRIQNIRLAYQFPKSWLERVNTKKLELYVTARDLYTFFGNNGFSPEIGGSAISSGIDTQTYPSQASINVGVNVQF